MATSNLAAFGLGGTLGNGLAAPESSNGYDEVPIVDSFPEE
jgi:hypothetical protein